ncbi:MPC domain containing protein [Asbolus verrucosus]|uniref:Mitochondrial pyruvate carrier n=1 Tax=Asbolus verrucosus TaxID=1661398 RepID=A0A482W0A6_ASBVE|nr:MPC domain containing protein [Asbolus verrucosus]
MSSIYHKTMSALDNVVPKKFQPFWQHPAGPKTIFFWAPLCKWGLVIAGLSDLVTRPADKLSIPQTTSLAITGVIWSRYSLVIIPKNYNLFSVNVFVALTQLCQLYRALDYQRQHKMEK